MPSVVIWRTRIGAEGRIENVYVLAGAPAGDTVSFGTDAVSVART